MLNRVRINGNSGTRHFPLMMDFMNILIQPFVFVAEPMGGVKEDVFQDYCHDEPVCILPPFGKRGAEVIWLRMGQRRSDISDEKDIQALVAGNKWQGAQELIEIKPPGLLNHVRLAPFR